MMERRTRNMRKRSRKASETEQVAEEPSPPPAKTRKRSASVKFTQTDEKRSQGNVRTRKKGFKVSFDIVEHNLSVGECATGVGASECVLTLGSTAEKKSPRAANGARRGNGAGSNDVGGMVKKPIDIKFKNSDFTFSYLSSIKKRSWKSYKQIIAAERAFSWKPSDPTCECSPGRLRVSSLDAPPPLKPAKKYADVSGFSAKYRDPLSGLLFTSSDEFRHIRSLPPDIIRGYLALRGKMPIM